jgi:D-galacturonate reductase
MKDGLDVTIVGGGMITNDLILPSVYHLKRSGIVENIAVCALNTPPLKLLKNNKQFSEGFPDLDFTPFPGIEEPEDKIFPELYLKVIAAMKPRQAVIVALPDPLHYRAVISALQANQHVVCVKPLVLKYRQAEEIKQLAREHGLFVGIEYHKRFDRRSLIARSAYAMGQFGEFRIGEAKLIEPYFYRNSNFQNWFTKDKTDPFTYIGCHYVDLVYFITGLKPVNVSVTGVLGKFPNGNEGYLWSHGRVRFENEAVLSVINGLGYPDEGAGSNEQCMTLFCEGNGSGALIKHNDQFRGVTHSYVRPLEPDGSRFKFVNPDFFRLVPWDGRGLKPVGYGYDSVASLIGTIHEIETTCASANVQDALACRRGFLSEVDERGILATPANSYINELVVEAARSSITRGGRVVQIAYEPDPHIKEQ